MVQAGHGGLGELVQYAGFTQERLEGRHGGALVLPAYMGIPQAAASLKTYIEGALAGAGSSSRSQNAELVMFDGGWCYLVLGPWLELCRRLH